MRAKVPSRRHEAELDVATPGDRARDSGSKELE